MSGDPKIRTRAPRGTVGSFRREHDPEAIAPFLEDAAHYPGGHCDEVCFPTCEAEVAAVLRQGRTIVVAGAQSSLTGGATPRGDVVLSTARLAALRDWTRDGVSAGAGVILHDLDAGLLARDQYFPPIPTYDGASVGGVVATNAAGAATFKHGTTRTWIDGLTVVLACGEVLDVERGQVIACDRGGAEGLFEIETRAGQVLRVPVPHVACPAVPKISAGYRGGAGLDLIDLFIGAEGTLGVVTEARLKLVSPRPRFLVVLVPVAGDAEALALTGALREAAQATWRQGASSTGAPGLDVAAVEYMDARSVQVLREDGVAGRVGVTIPPDAQALLLVQAELPPDYDRARAYAELAAHGAVASRGPVAQLCSILEAHGVLDAAVPALPDEEERRRALFALREAVPEGINRRVRENQRVAGPAVSKSGGDVIVPFERLQEALAGYRRLIRQAGLDAAIWGHVSDGNVHPNILARNAAEMDEARRVQMAIGRLAIEMGGSPMAEHGTGRNPAKKALLEALHGPAGVASMRATKRALDPHWQLAPGVLFDAE